MKICLVQNRCVLGLMKVDEFIRVYHGTRYLVLFGGGKYDFIYNRVRHVIAVKIGITYDISHNYAKSKLIHTILCPWKKH